VMPRGRGPSSRLLARADSEPDPIVERYRKITKNKFEKVFEPIAAQDLSHRRVGAPGGGRVLMEVDLSSV